jgi:glycosyltransferase involved in cell wall biosynthesis
VTLRVLHVIPSFAGGGAERQLTLLCGALADAGVEVHIAHMHDGPNLAAALACGARLHRIETSGNHDPRALTRLLHIIRHVRPSLVQTWLLHADVFGGLAAKLSRVPWVLSERSSEAMYASGAKFALRRRLGRTATAVAANSEGGLAYWRQVGFRGHGRVIGNIVTPPSEAGSIAPEFAHSFGTEQPLILTVGRLSAEKNLGCLLGALERVFARHPNTVAAFLGEGPERGALERQIAASSELRGRVRLPGHVAHVPGWLRAAAMLVSLSSYEGMPNAVVEAMTHGCPVVVSDIPAHREIVDADCGVLVQPEVNTVSEAILAVLADPESADRRAERARQKMTRWSPEAVAAAYLELYRHLVSGEHACAF